MCYYFDDVIKFEDFNLDDILIDEKSYKHILVYIASYKTLMSAKILYIRFNKMNGFIIVHDGTRYLVLLGGEKYHFIYYRIKHLVGLKSGITYVISYNFAKIKFDLYHYLPSEKTLTLHNVIILFRPVFKKDVNKYYYNIFLEKGSHELPENNDNK